VTPDDVLAITAALHDRMDQAADARAATAVRGNRPIVCGPGCTGCCEELVMVFLPEALRVARWLEQPQNEAVRQAFLEAYPRWLERSGEAARRLSDNFASEDEAAQRALHVEHWRKRVMCAFNREGLCSIYAVRPLLCRNAHALETPARCFGDHPDPNAQIVHLRMRGVDDFVANTRKFMRAAHHALGGGRMRPQALCVAVYEILTRDAT
jgi:Fe-S-cluster containining protein